MQKKSILLFLFFLAFPSVFLYSQENASKKSPSYFLKIDSLEVNDLQNMVECKGTTNFPVGTILQILWKRILADQSSEVSSQYGMIHGERFYFPWSTGNKKLFPGKYQVVLFFSPVLQQNIVLPWMGWALGGQAIWEAWVKETLAKQCFVECQENFSVGTTKEYAQVFTKETRNLEEILGEIHRCFSAAYTHYQQAKLKKGMEYWLPFRKRYIQRVDQLREKLDNAHKEYFGYFLPNIEPEMHSLINLLEMFQESLEMDLREGGEYCQYRIQQFCERYPYVSRELQYSMIAISPEEYKSQLLWNAMHKLQKSCKEYAPCSSSQSLDTSQQEFILVHLLLLQKAYKRLRNISDPRFIEESNRWLRDLQEILSKLETPPRGMIQGKAHACFYELILTLTQEWIKMARLQKIALPKEPSDFSGPLPGFEEAWQKTIQVYAKENLLQTSLQKEVRDIKEHLAMLKQMLQQEESPDAWEEKVREWSAHWVYRQKLNRDFASLSKRAPKEIEELMTDYLSLCLHLMNFYDLTTMYWQGGLDWKLVEEELKKIESMCKQLEKKVK